MSETPSNPQLVLSHPCQLGEGPVWDENTQTLYWVDILAGTIHSWNSVTHQHMHWETKDLIGAVAVCTDGRLLAALQNGLLIFNQETGEKQWLSGPEPNQPSNRFNDGKCDPKGRFWIGSMCVHETTGAGSLYQFILAGGLQQKIPGITISNGLAWSLDHRTMYFIDTPTYEVWAFDFDLETGSIGNKRVVITIPQSEGYPDGMTIDSEGMLWIAHWDGWQVARWDPNTGNKLHSIHLPVARVTSCCFGGRDWNDLYITTAGTGLSAEAHQEQPLAGCLFVVKNSGYKGFAFTPFQV